MSETVNIGEIANKLSEEIFSYFHWKSHERKDQDFLCHNDQHTSKGKKIAPKKTHPGDVIFYYDDPYLSHRIYLHTDLKSYKKNSIGTVKIRAAIESLAMTVECARSSADWRKAYSVSEELDFDVRGLLFVHNHDGLFQDDFADCIAKTDLGTIPIAPNVYIHFLGPRDINRLFSITMDIMRLQNKELLPKEYSFYYPDLVLHHRTGDTMAQAATIEALTAPYFIITYDAGEKRPPGYVIYYNRPGTSPNEFEYFLDSLSRYQMLEREKFIRIRMVSVDIDLNFLSNFSAAKERYVKAWGLDPSRKQILDDIVIERVHAMTTTYNAPEIGWDRSKK